MAVIARAAVARAVGLGAGLLVLLVLLVTGWGCRPVATAHLGMDRLLPAVADPDGPLAPRDYPPQMRAPDPAPGSGAGGLVWETSRGYPVSHRPAVAAGPPRAPIGSASYTWLLPGERPATAPLRWSPCAPILVRTNPAGLGPAARAAIRWAFAELQARTGLQVRLGPDTGETVEGSLSGRDWTEGTWTTARRQTWSPVLVLASDGRQTPELAGRPAGWTTVHTGSGATGRRIVSGVVALDREDLGDAGTVAGQRQLRMLLLHELGHLVGLGHVADPDLVMHPDTALVPGQALTYRYGDLRGLAVAGRGPC